MRLYYFTSSRFGLEAIRDERIKISRISSLNDPFELLAYDLRNKTQRAWLKRQKKRFDVDYGVICMSDNWTHPLMWSHYADRHKGICLGFDVNKNAGFRRVDYEPSRPPIPAQALAGGLPTLVLFDRLFMTKFEGWKYEGEYRSKEDLKKNVRDPVSGLHFRPFSQDLKLTEVIVG